MKKVVYLKTNVLFLDYQSGKPIKNINYNSMNMKIMLSKPNVLQGFKVFNTLLFFLITSALSAQTRSTPGVPQTFNVSSPALLNATYSSNLIPGDVVIVANGTYSNSFTMRINGVGSAANPITYRAATPGGVILTGGQTMDIGGEYCVIDGFYWKGGNGASNFIEFRDSFNYGNNSILQNCVVDGLQGTSPNANTSVKHNWVVLYGTNNTVINCSFLNKTTSGNMILGEYQFNASPLGDDATNKRCDVVGHKILNNYFYNYSKIDSALTNSGDSETIRLGTSEYQNVNSNATVQNNYFVQADGENEIITNKSKGNFYINNTFRRCRGSLVLRHGSNTTVDGNYFLGENVDGTGGIRIVDSNQIITNNYIQDCITVGANAIWNNGITFLGGNDSSAVVCTSTSMTNGYQRVQNLNLSNNTIVNTNAPLFYNLNTGTTDPTGVVSNNLFYFAPSNPNITDILTGNGSTGNSYNELGSALNYTGNVYKGTALNTAPVTAPASGFSLESGITATASGEIFAFTGATGKGATISQAPITDAMVSKEIGACFVNNLGVSVTTGNCNIIIPESIVIGTLTSFTHLAGSKDVSVTANVGWSAVSNDSWITMNTPSGTGDATVSVTVTANTGSVSRSGTVTFTQTSGTTTPLISRTLSITQDAPPPPDPRDGLNLINKTGSDASVFYVSNEEIVVGGSNPKDNRAVHSLDKDFNTQWASNGTADPSGFSIIIYDLKGAFDLDLVDIATTNAKTYMLQILVSSTGTADADFTNPFPSGDLISNTDASFKAFVLPSRALGTKYVKLIGKGQSNSPFTTIHEIEFYGNANSLSVDEKQLNNQVKIYPNPVSDLLKLSELTTPIKSLEVYTIDGKKVMEKPIKSLESDININVSSLSNGAYILNIINSDASRESKMFLVSH